MANPIYVNPIFPTPLPTRRGIILFDPVNVATTYQAVLNPTKILRRPATARKYTRTTNGQAVILGQSEYPPQEIALTWNQLDKGEVDKIRQFVLLSQCVFIDNNDQGYLGTFMIDELEQLANYNGSVWMLKASFLVLSPYNGQSSTLLTLTGPTLTANPTSPGGYIAGNGYQFYLWATAFTAIGESTVGAVTAITTGAGLANIYYNLSFTAPTSKFYRKTRIYWNTVNTPGSATLLAEVLSGLPPSFTAFTPYNPYNSINPPLINTAFTGSWAGTLFTSLT